MAEVFVESRIREVDGDIRRDVPNSGASRSGSDPSPSASSHSVDEEHGDPQPSTPKPYMPAGPPGPEVRAVVVQGPDGALYVGTEHSELMVARLARTAQSSAAQDGRPPFDFGEHVSLDPSRFLRMHACMHAQCGTTDYGLVREQLLYERISHHSYGFFHLSLMHGAIPRATCQLLLQRAPPLVWRLSTSSCQIHPPPLSR